MVKKQEKVVVAAPVVAKVELTEAQKIWNEVKGLEIEMFALPNQKVHQYVKQVSIDPSRLFLIANATSVLPALELVVDKKFTIEKIDRFLVLTRK